MDPETARVFQAAQEVIRAGLPRVMISMALIIFAGLVALVWMRLHPVQPRNAEHIVRIRAWGERCLRRPR